MNKKLIAPIVTAAAMLATSIGSTFALFTSKASSRIDINAGRVAVNYDATVSKALSRYLDEEPWDAIANKTETHAATFENGSTADISVESTGAVVTLDRLAPMDMIELKVGAENDSNINIKFRYFIKASGDLLPALDLIVDGASLEVPGSSLEFYSAWSSVMTPDVESLFEKNIGIYFPDHGEDDNQYQEKTATLEVGIEAIQGNAEVHDPVDPDPVDVREDIHSKKPSGAGKSVNMESKTGSQSYVVPFEACKESAEELVLTIIPEEEPTAEVPAGKDVLPYDIHIEGIKEDNTAEIEARIGIGQGKTNVQVFHDGTEIESKYVEDEGSVYFKATSFSPYDVVFDAARETGYGFYNSYKVDEGLETEHWVHEISDAEEFKNIVDSTVHDLKTEAYDYPGAHDEDTVYSIIEDIDFGGEIWSTQELIDEVNAYPFIGHLIGAEDGKELSNVHVTKNYNGVDDKATFCIFGRAVNATFENLTISDCSINTSTGDKSAIFCCGNKTKEAAYRTLLEDNTFTIKYIEFKNILIDETCSVSVNENGAGICAVLRDFSDHILFENCINNASIRANTNNVAGILGQASENPESGGHTTPVTLRGCENYGTISGDGGNVGGIAGNLCSKAGTVTNCSNNGNIYHNNTGSTVGSIIGNNSANGGVTFTNCSNSKTIYTKRSSGNLNVYDFSYGLKVLYNNKTVDEVTLEEFKELFVREYVGTVIGVSLDENTNEVNVDTTDGADHYTMVISTTKVDIDMATNKAVPQRSGSLTLCAFDNLTAAEVNDFALIRQLGYFAPGEGECPVDEYHGGTRIGSRGAKCTSEYFLDYSLHGTAGYEAGYGKNSNGGYFILDNTGCVDYYPCLITWRISVTYSVIGYDADGKIVSSGNAIYAPYSLGGDNNYTTKIVGYVPEN